MALDENMRILSGVAFFEGFAPDQLRLLAFSAEQQRLRPGDELFRAGAPADGAFILIDGLLELFALDGGEKVPMGRVRPGAMLGELALIADTRRPTGAAALAESRLLRLERKNFRRVLEEYPDLAMALHKRVANDIRTLVESIERLAPRFS